MINWKRSRVTQLRPWPPWDTNRSRPLDLGRFGDQPRIGTAHIFWNRPRIVTAFKKNGEPTSHSFRNQSLTRNITISWIKNPVSNRASDKLQNWENYIQKNLQPRIHLIITHHFSITFPSLFHHFSWLFYGDIVDMFMAPGISVSQVSGHKTWPEKKRAIPQPVSAGHVEEVTCPCHRCHDR